MLSNVAQPLMRVRFPLMILWITLILSPTMSDAQSNCTPNPRPIARFYQQHGKHLKSLSFQQRIDVISRLFMGAPYATPPLGGGCDDPYNPRPLYRLDVMDCITYIDTVLALSHADTPQQFVHYMNHFRYLQRPYTYFNEAHFPNSDWNRHIQAMGVFKDITREIKGPDNQTLAHTATTPIDKPRWFSRQVAAMTLSPKQRHQAKQLIQHSHKTISHISYIPLDKLYDAQQHPIEAVFNQIPSGCLIEIVRPNWDLREKIGSKLDVSHLGFVFRTPQGLIFRHSHEYDQVVELPLAVYLAKYLNSSTVGGIHIQQISLMPDKLHPMAQVALHQ